MILIICFCAQSIGRSYKTKRRRGLVAKLKWLSNAHEDDCDQHWIRRNIIGRPQATEKHTVESLEAQGMIGVCAEQEEGGDE